MATPLVLDLPAATLADLAAIRRFVQDGAIRLGADAIAADDLGIAIDEAATNVIRYGYRDRPGPIRVELSVTDGELAMRLADTAPLFDPTKECPAPDLDLDLGERPLGGMGIHLMRTSVDRLVHAGRGQTSGNAPFVLPQLLEECQVVAWDARFQAALRGVAAAGPDGAVEGVLAAIGAFAAGEPAADDITLLAIGRAMVP